MKLIRRAVICLLILGAIAVVLIAVGHRLLHRSPSWYRADDSIDPQVMADAADRLQHKVEVAHSWTALAQNEQQHPHATPQSLLGPTSRPGVLDPLELTLSEEELNAFYQRWNSEYGWSEKYADYLRNPQLVIRDNSLILAATVPMLNVIVSLDFRPTIENGLLRLQMAKVMAGELSLPPSIWHGYRDQLSREVTERLPALQRLAALKPDGSANDQMVAAVLIKLMLHVLRDEPAEPVLFLPYLQNFREHSLPVKLIDAHIDDASKSLVLRFEPLSAEERAALIASVRESPGVAPAGH